LALVVVYLAIRVDLSRHLHVASCHIEFVTGLVTSLTVLLHLLLVLLHESLGMLLLLLALVTTADRSEAQLSLCDKRHLADDLVLLLLGVSTVWLGELLRIRLLLVARVLTILVGLLGLIVATHLVVELRLVGITHHLLLLLLLGVLLISGARLLLLLGEACTTVGLVTLGAELV